MKEPTKKGEEFHAQYETIFADLSGIIDTARRTAACSVNTVITAIYWLIGHRLVEFEQSGKKRADYGAVFIQRLAADLTQRFGRGYSRQNIQQMRLFYLLYPISIPLKCILGTFSRSFCSLGSPGFFQSRESRSQLILQRRPCSCG